MTQRTLLDRIQISQRFCGPPTSGNGGYTSGVLAQYLAGTTEVTLRQPPPLDKELTVAAGDEGAVGLYDGDQVIAEAKPAELDLAVPGLPPEHDVAAAAKRFAGFTHRVFPTCFVCGPEREPNDGLRIFAGPCDVAGSPESIVAAPWVPDASLAGQDGKVADPFVWSALDCPGYFAALQGSEHTLALLGRFTVEIIKPVAVGEPATVLGWRIAQEGRKHVVGTALYNAPGELCAKGRAFWIELKSG